jgi:hypothetical protein
MVARLRSWWQQFKKHRVTILTIAIILVVAIALIILGYRFDWTGFNGNSKSGKTLWDWLQLLIIPAVLALGGYLFTYTISKNERKAADRHNQTEREIAQDNQREAALQECIDKLSELLLHVNLRESKPEDEVRKIARLRTLTVLPRLDGKRKGTVLQFLHESGVIKQGKSSFYLRGADLSGANLIGVNLNNVNLNGANLTGAFLGGANLWGADLIEVNLNGANLLGADLTGADLLGADLTGANLNAINLTGVDLARANLRDAHGIKIEKLEYQTKSLKGATMPDGSIHP